MSKELQSEVVTEYCGELKICYTHEYHVDRWEEECHGIHSFEDIDTKNIIIGSVSICLEDIEIDITSRLTKSELKELENALW